MTKPALRAVPASGELPVDGPSYGDALHIIGELQDENSGLRATVLSQAKRIGRLERERKEDADPTNHPKGAEMVALVERWRRGAEHPQAKVSKDRLDLIRARLKDDYPISSEDEFPSEPTLELAVDGLCAYPYVAHGTRQREGTPSQRHDRLGIALAGGEKVEEFSRLGYRARKEGLVTWG